MILIFIRYFYNSEFNFQSSLNYSVDVRYCIFRDIHTNNNNGAISMKNEEASFYGIGLLFSNCSTDIIVGYFSGGIYFKGTRFELHQSCFFKCVSFHCNAFCGSASVSFKSRCVYFESCRPLSMTGVGDDGTFAIYSKSPEISEYNVTKCNNNEDAACGSFSFYENHGFLKYSYFYNNVGQGLFLFNSVNESSFNISHILCLKCESKHSGIGVIRSIGKIYSSTIDSSAFINVSFVAFVGSLSTGIPVLKNSVFSCSSFSNALLINNVYQSYFFTPLPVSLLNESKCEFTKPFTKLEQKQNKQYKYIWALFSLCQ